MQPDWRRVEDENPSLSVRSACFIGEGWNARAYLVNDELVFKFPKRPEHWEELNREIAFLAFAADKLPLPAPRYLRQARQSTAGPCGYATYRYLRGGSMDLGQLSRQKRVAAATALGGFLRAIHTLQPSPDLAARLPSDDARLIAEQYFARAEREIARKLPPADAGALVRVLEMYLSSPQNFRFTPAILHADLSRDHILIENDTVAGIIDFGDVSWGDPDYDFMYLFVDFGFVFAEEVARAYGHSNLEQLRSKSRYFGIIDQIETILDDGGLALEGQAGQAWQRLTQLLRDS